MSHYIFLWETRNADRGMAFIGPGMEASSQPPNNSGMLKVLMDKGYQVLQLDQRGTGLSTPISGTTLLERGNVEEQVRYLKLFRADNIGKFLPLGWRDINVKVRDCEAIRAILLAHREDKRWSILGQSFGGFCCITYLSFAYVLSMSLLNPLDLQVYVKCTSRVAWLLWSPAPMKCILDYSVQIQHIRQTNEQKK